MKTNAILHYVMAILEGGLSGVYLYHAQKEEDRTGKILMYLTSAVWFAGSVVNSLLGGRELREAKAQEMIDGGDDYE